MAEITIEELGAGVVLEITRADGKRCRYSAPDCTRGDNHTFEVDVFFGGGGNDNG